MGREINRMKLPNNTYVEYLLDDNSCWNVINRNTQADGTIGCKVIYSGKKYNSLIRLSYDLFHKKNTSNEITIKRKCKNKKCVNPNHLFEKRVGDWRISEVGNKYGKLEIIEYDGDYSDINRDVTCRCECGNVKNININSIKTKSKNHVVSCGCVRNEKIGNLNKTHNKSKTRLYRILANAKNRCYNVSGKKYKHYGGRGITICNAWIEDFDNFYKWANDNGYEEGLSLDRIDVNGNYEPSNCRWVTMDKQASNKQNTIWVDYQGSKVCLRDLMVKLDKLSKYESVKNFLFKDGFSIEEALSINDKTDRFIMKMKYLLIENNVTNCSINIEQLSTLTEKSVKTLRKRYLNTDRFTNMLNTIDVEVLND